MSVTDGEIADVIALSKEADMASSQRSQEEAHLRAEDVAHALFMNPKTRHRQATASRHRQATGDQSMAAAAAAAATTPQAV